MVAIAFSSLLRGIEAFETGPDLHGTVTDLDAGLKNGLSLEPMRLEFELTDHRGSLARAEDFGGKVALLFFGYTSCPDICPTSLSDLHRALEGLPADIANEARVLMVSVDPDRDSPEVMARYLEPYGPLFVGLHGEKAAIDLAGRPLGLSYRKNLAYGGSGSTDGAPSASNTSYAMDHSSSIAIFDAEGRLRSIYPFGTDPNDIRVDIQTLVEETR